MQQQDYHSSLSLLLANATQKILQLQEKLDIYVIAMQLRPAIRLDGTTLKSIKLCSNLI